MLSLAKLREALAPVPRRRFPLPWSVEEKAAYKPLGELLNGRLLLDLFLEFLAFCEANARFFHAAKMKGCRVVETWRKLPHIPTR